MKMPEPIKPAIMVVDDIAANIDLLVEILGDDFDVRAALDGPSALEDILEDLPDLLLLDIMMPGMDGYEVCRRLKADERTRDMPVIFVTAKGEIEDEVKGFESGAVDYIAKPVSAPIVKARVVTHLALEQARQALKDRNRILKENVRLREEVDRISRHDLKTPLNSIISLPRILMADSRTPQEHMDTLKNIEQSGYTMLNMINRSLDLVKMENHTYGLTPEAVDMHGVVRKIISDLDGAAGEKYCRFIIRINGKAPGKTEPFIMSGESLLCYSMAANLIKNALEACPGHSDVGIDMAVSNDKMALFTVRNQGMVPESIRKNFFEKYATAGKEGGSGLGTYSARLMALTMGGAINMTTHPDEGTRIEVRLPLPLPDQINLGKKDPVLSKTDFQARKFSSLRLLIADDDPDNLRILRSFLSHSSLRVDQAENGQEAFEKWRCTPYDLIFMDIEMPVMGGMEAICRIRAEENRSGEPETKAIVIALSAHDDEFARTCMAAGFDGFLTKPVSPGDLYEYIEKYTAEGGPPGCLTLQKSITEDGPASEEDFPDVVAVDKDLEEIIPVFLKNKGEQIREILEHIRHQDFSCVRKVAHKLKGGFNMYGITGLGAICAGLEQAAMEKDTEEVSRLGQELSRRFTCMEIRFR